MGLYTSFLIWEVLLVVALVWGGTLETPHKGSRGKTKGGPIPTPIDNGQVSYWFKSEVSDPPRGFSQSRAEVKRGSQVQGKYEYSDGFVRVKVVYTADHRGYRVIKEERIPLKKIEATAKPHFTKKEKKKPVQPVVQFKLFKPNK